MLKNKASSYQCFGIKCCHTYSSNPRLIDLYVSKNGTNYSIWANLELEYTSGDQLFLIDPITPKYKYLKVIIKATFGANQTYLNQIFVCAEHPNASIPVKQVNPTPCDPPVQQPKNLLSSKLPKDLYYDDSEYSKGDWTELRSPIRYNETENGTMTARDLAPSDHFFSKQQSVRVSMEHKEILSIRSS